MFNIVEMVADHEDCAFDQPCKYGHRVEGHAVYCHNDEWKEGPRKCRHTWYTGGEVRDEDCEGFASNPEYKQPNRNCIEDNGDCVFPIYGVGPHKHVGVIDTLKSWVGSTVALPKEEWPTNYQEDPECPGCGTYWCADCGEGKPSNC